MMSLKDDTSKKVSTGRNGNRNAHVADIWEHGDGTQVGRTGAARQALEM